MSETSSILARNWGDYQSSDEEEIHDVNDSESDFNDSDSEAIDSIATTESESFVEMNPKQKSFEDYFTFDWHTMWIAMPHNSLANMRKFISTDNVSGYEISIRWGETNDLINLVRLSSVPLIIRTFEGSIIWKDLKVKMYTTQTEYLKEMSYATFMDGCTRFLVERDADNPYIITEECCNCLDSVFSFSEELSILRILFIPNEKEIEYFWEKGMALMIPSSKIITPVEDIEEITTTVYEKYSDNLVNMKLVQREKGRKWVRAFVSREYFLCHYGYMDKTKSKLTKISSVPIKLDKMRESLMKMASTYISTTMEEEDLISSSLRSKTQVELTKSGVAKYLKVRSTLMEKAFAETMMVGSYADKTLVPFRGDSFIGDIKPWLKNISRLTPDIIICKETSFDWEVTKLKLSRILKMDIDDSMIYFIEVKVSDQGSKINVANAERSYSGFCERINSRAQELGMMERAVVKVIEFNLDNWAVASEFFSSTGNKRSEVKDWYTIIQTHWKKKLQNNRDYKKIKLELDSRLRASFNLEYIDLYFGEYFCRDVDKMFDIDAEVPSMKKPKMTQIGNEVLSFGMSIEQAELEISSYAANVIKMIATDNARDDEEVFNKLYTKEDIEGEVNRQESKLKAKNEVFDHLQMDIKKAFKIPCMAQANERVSVDEIFSLLHHSAKTGLLKDGTFFAGTGSMEKAGLMNSFWFPNKKYNSWERENLKKGHPFSRDLAIDMEELIKDLETTQVDELLTKEACSMIIDATTLPDSFKNAMKRYCSNKVMSLVFNLQLLMKEIAQLEGRRVAAKDKSGKRVSVKKICVFKRLGNMYLEIKGGSLLRQNAAIRFRVWAREEDQVILNTMGFHSFFSVSKSKLCATKYLTLYPIDLVTHLTVFEASMMMVVGYFDKMCEINPDRPPSSEETYSLSVRIMQLVEHRNNTSAASQLSRYLLMGGTSIHADRLGCIKEIGMEPIRSVFQNYTIMKQLDWSKKTSEMRTGIIQQMMLAQDYDPQSSPRLYIPSFYSSEVVEVSMLLDEIYFCNLMDPNYGTRKHMTEATLKKMASFEMLWREKISKKEMVDKMRGVLSSIPWLSKENKDMETFFEFDRVMVVASTKILMKRVSKEQLALDFFSKMNESILAVMTLKSNIKSTGGRTIYDTSTLLEERATAFESMKFLIDKYRCHTVMDACNLFPCFDYFFGEFPKPQVGGPREILIQDCYTRCKARVLENFFNSINKQFPDEMTSNSSQKFTRQANMDMMLDADFRNYPEREVNLTFANNKDHSKWSPSSNILQYTYMVKGMDLPNSMALFLITALLAYAHCMVGMPREMKDTYMNLGMDKIEASKEAEVCWIYKEFTKGRSMVVLKSGWPQGMLQFCSSTYHVVQKMLQRFIWEKAAEVLKVNWAVYDMITSDDTTDYGKVGADDMSSVVTFLRVMLSIGYMVGTTFNMHENRKKTNLQIFMKEFNSIFQVGRRVLTPIIKFLAKSVSVPDCTYPEEAVKELVSMEQMLLENGASMNILKACRVCHKRMLADMYNQALYKRDLTHFFQCEEEELPFELGFLPSEMILESIIYGVDIYMFNKSSAKIKEFRSKIFSTDPKAIDFFSINKTSYTTSLLFKEKLKLPMKLDKKMKEMKERVGVTEGLMEQLIQSRFDVLMEGEDSRDIFLASIAKVSSMNVRYDMNTGFLYKAHSLVRANQINSDLCSLTFKTQEVRTILDYVTEVMKSTSQNMEALDMHPMKALFTQVMRLDDEFWKAIQQDQMTLSRSYSVKKFRRVETVNNEVFPTMSKQDAYRIYRLDPTKRRSREKYKASVIKRYYKLTSEFTEESIMRYLTEKQAANSQMLYSMFENVISLMSQTHMTLPFEEVNSVNAMENLYNLKRHREVTGYVYSKEAIKILEEASIVTSADIVESTGYIGSIAETLSDAMELYKMTTTKLQRKKFDTKRAGTSLAEKYVMTMNRLVSSGKELDMNTLLVTQPNLYYYASTRVDLKGKFSIYSLLRMWAFRDWILCCLSNRTTYEFFIMANDYQKCQKSSNINDAQVDEIKKTMNMERAAMGDKMAGSLVKDNFETYSFEDFFLPKVEAKFFTASQTIGRLGVKVDGLTQNWHIENIMRLDGVIMDTEALMVFKMTTCRHSNFYPIITEDKLKKLSSEDLKNKMIAFGMLAEDITKLSALKLEQIASLWLTQEDKEVLNMMWEEAEELPDYLKAFCFYDSDMSMYASAIDAFTMDVMAPLEQAVISEEEAEGLLATGDEFAFKVDDNIAAILSRISEKRTLEMTEEDNLEVNKRAMEGISKRAIYDRVRNYITKELALSTTYTSLAVEREFRVQLRFRKKIDRGELAFDVLKSLRRRIELTITDQDKARSIFLMTAKVFLLAVFKRDSMVKVTAHSNTPWVCAV